MNDAQYLGVMNPRTGYSVEIQFSLVFKIII